VLPARFPPTREVADRSAADPEEDCPMVEVICPSVLPPADPPAFEASELPPEVLVDELVAVDCTL
jgi:hypothetical protein